LTVELAAMKNGAISLACVTVNMA